MESFPKASGIFCKDKAFSKGRPILKVARFRMGPGASLGFQFHSGGQVMMGGDDFGSD
jgi:hypothetical protein